MSESVVGEWAKDKLRRLEAYLNPYTTIMKGQRWCTGFHYVDAFAGPGQHQVRSSNDPSKDELQSLFSDAAVYQSQAEEHKELINGSPLMALNLEHPFTTYTFVEKNPDRVARLNELATKYAGTRSISVVSNDCARFLKEEFVPAHDWATERAVVFLDPFGMQVNWDTIETLARTKAIEIFLNFPVGMAIQRLLLRKPGEFTESSRKKLDEYFGTSEWFDVIYKKHKTLFGEDEASKIEDSSRALLKWYKGRLKTAFGNVSSAYLIRNSRNGHLYYLILASRKPVAAKIASAEAVLGERIRD